MSFLDSVIDTANARPVSPWGKLGGAGSHHLAHHCADVAACFETIARLPVVRSRLESAAGRPLSGGDIARLAVLAFLHDVGKLHPGFQAKGWPKDAWRAPQHGHVQEGAAIFFRGVHKGQIARNLNVERIGQWGCSTDLLTAAFAHHGRPFSIENNATQRWEAVAVMGYDALLESATIGALLPEWFRRAFVESGEQLPANPEFQHLFCGLVSLADWLGSDQRIFAFRDSLDSSYISLARQRASEAVATIGLEVTRWRALAGDAVEFSNLAPGMAPREAQKVVGEWPLDDHLVILESETGSGKTEAALWRFARLFVSGKVASLYFALPTRAAAKQIHDRVNQAMKNLFGRNAPEAVLAVPGYLKYGAVEGQRLLPSFEVLWDDAPSSKDGFARWAAENAKRYLAATIAVGTVDQAMLSVLQVKHAHLRSAALSRSFLVIDEVHASDRYMTEVQKHLLDTHLGRGGFAMLMSATLGSAARTRWLGGTRGHSSDFEEAVAAPYPVVWGRNTGHKHAGAQESRQKRVAMSLANSWTPEEAAQRANVAASHGARVLVVRNTVKAAIDTFNAVIAAGGENSLWKIRRGPALHHSRFAPEDRKLLDSEVERALSKDKQTRPTGGVIVIGTQTLEQSLDICADFLITDLCPADVLLQRIGRLHRHELSRPVGYENPQCIVLAPENGLDRLTAPAFDNGLGMFKQGGGVYTNLHACELTRQLVVRHAEWIIPGMNRLLVESATHEQRIEALNADKGKAWEDYWNTAYGKEIAEATGARGVLLRIDTPFGELGFPGDEEKIRTRLGVEGIQIKFAEAIDGPFGQKISGITLPAHWSHGIETVEPIRPAVDENGKLMIRADKVMFRYGRQGLEKERS